MPEDINGRTKLKVVYVVLEAQYQSALTAAVRNINATRDKVCGSVPQSLLVQFACLVRSLEILKPRRKHTNLRMSYFASHAMVKREELLLNAIRFSWQYLCRQ